MPTAHEVALESSFQRSLLAGNGATIAEVHTKLLDHHYEPDWLVDAIFQTRGTRPSMLDAYGFMLVWSIGCAPVWLGHEPAKDAAHAENQKRLDSIQPPFRATVIPQRGKSANDDGKFEWREDITLSWRPGESREDRIVKPNWIALEIGTTKVSKTLIHVRGAFGVARWPYGHERLVILYSPTWRRAHPITAKMETTDG